MVHDHGVPGAVGKIGEHAPVCGAHLARVGGNVVVDVLLGDGLAEAFGQAATVGELAGHAEADALLVAGGAGVRGGSSGDGQGGWTNDVWPTW